MCKRDCIYAETENIHFGAGQHCCNYVVAMLATDREQKTRLGALVKKYKLPSTHRKIKLLMPIERVQKILGHVKITTTQLYIYVDDTDVQHDYMRYR